MLFLTIVSCAVFDMQDQARVHQTALTAARIAQQLEMKKTETDSFPSALESAFPNGVPHDAWERAFLYETTGDGFVLTSLGADGKAGGSGHAADVRFPQEDE